MPQSAAQVTAADISRLAGVTRATVSNWRRRHADFPAPVGGTETSPAYDAEEVRAWLARRGQLPRRTPREELRDALRTVDEGGGRLAVRTLPLVSALAELDEDERVRLAHADEQRQRESLERMTDERLTEVAEEGRPRQEEVPAEVLRCLLECVATEGAPATLDVLAEVVGEDPETGTPRTPRPLAELMVSLLASNEGRMPNSVFDPACGGGQLLLAAAEAGAAEVFGQDVLGPQVALSSVRLEVASSAEAVVRRGDSLRADGFPELRAQGVVCGPPYGQRDWGHEEVAYDPRWVYGLPPKSESELAWVQHCLAHLEPGGRAVLLLPPGVAERSSGRRIRSQLVRSGALRAVLALPPGAAVPAHLGLHLWVLAAPEPEHREVAPVLFVHTPEDEARPSADPQDSFGGRRSSGSTRGEPDWGTLRQRMLTTWREFVADPEGFDTVAGVACARPAVDVLDENVDLTPRRQVHTGGGGLDPARQYERVRRWRDGLRHVSERLLESLDGQEWSQAGAEPLSWRSVTVADLLRGGALELYRVSSGGRDEPLHGEAPEGRRVLTSADLWRGREPDPAADTPLSEEVELAEGDVVLPDTLKGGHQVPVRVAGPEDAGALLGRGLYLLRPDPLRLDPWFLAGFLGTEENAHGATTGSSILRLHVRRLRVPLVPPERQRDYGGAFRKLHEMRTAARAVHRIARETAAEVAAGLTGGALLPREQDSGEET
ncbi:N-6 DNA methylase [Actinopolyspora mortivallis]|uniref:DNA methylase adenine-specific domain-containing protein n=1 Tax=Actinopolyspora mortivallis TaxID=33906 RepID=A0A2T0H1G8_ACTMO|nr:N-6 DNA methylase [Actinopolyspora mortivallis]PRW65224.1 hypothetical protein CEP50_01470 [Actinopolyspora mortivallis]